MNKRFICIVMVFLCLALPWRASAQIVMSAGADVSSFAAPGDNLRGVSLAFGGAHRIGMFQIGVSVYDLAQKDDAGNSLGSMRGTADISYLWRLFGNAGHSFNVYGGAGAFAGYDRCGSYDYFDPVYNAVMQKDDSGFIAGLYPELQAELYLLDRFGLFLDGKARWCARGMSERFVPTVGAGIRILF